MPTTDQFWQYAKEAILSASYAKTDEDRRDMLDLARTWTQAALLERQAVNHDGRLKPAPHNPLVDKPGSRQSNKKQLTLCCRS
jgi:hypothetical protein